MKKFTLIAVSLGMLVLGGGWSLTHVAQQIPHQVVSQKATMMSVVCELVIVDGKAYRDDPELLALVLNQRLNEFKSNFEEQLPAHLKLNLYSVEGELLVTEVITDGGVD